MEAALACEAFRDGVVGQPANTLTAFAFLLAATAVLAGRPAPVAGRWRYGILVALVGVGSVIQHGPHPAWQAYAHDLTLAAALAYLAADAAGDLLGQRAPTAAVAWLVPTAAIAPLVAVGPTWSTVGQVGLAAAAIGLNLWRGWRHPALRRPLLVALGLLAAGALAGTLGDRTGLCQPASLMQGHALWHLFAAAALWQLAPAVGARAEERPGRLRSAGVQ